MKNGYIEIVEKKKRSLTQSKKEKIKWVIDGDENTRFFHGYANNKSRSTRINSIMIIGEWCMDPMKIKAEVL